MARRLFDSAFFKNDFVRSLNRDERDLWMFIILNADLFGVLDLQFEEIRYQCQFNLSNDQIVEIINSKFSARISWDNTGKMDKLWVKNHFLWQRNFPLNPLNQAHRTIVLSLLDNLSLFEAIPEYRYAYAICRIDMFFDENGVQKDWYDKATAHNIMNQQKIAIRSISNTDPPAIVLPGIDKKATKPKGGKTLQDLKNGEAKK